MSGRVIIVSNRLPLSIVERGGLLTADRSIGGLATALSSVFAKHDPLWVGWTGVRRILTPKELRSLDLPTSIVPVQAPEELIERYYDHFCNRVLWPSLHDIDPCIEPKESDWDAYVAMNDRFAEVLVGILQPDDVVWVHDSHLLMLPQALRDRGVGNKIGFFLHTPFPEPARFLGMMHAQELLLSLSQLDVLGLQTQRDVETFWGTLQQSHLQQQPGLVRAFPIGIDFPLYRQAFRRDDVEKLRTGIRDKAGNRKLLLSISRLDHTKGILQQLKAVEQFMREQADPTQFVYKLVVAPSRENVPEYQELKKDIAEEVRRINKSLGESGWRPVDYLYENIDFPMVVACYLTADIMLLTPPIDGMNLIAKEYVASRTDDSGMLVIGNQIGAAFQLEDAILVDALSVESIVAGLQHASHMTMVERTIRWKTLRKNVREHDVFWWAESFLAALQRTQKVL